MYMHMYICMHAVCLDVCMYVRVHSCMFVRAYVCMYEFKATTKVVREVCHSDMIHSYVTCLILR